MVFKVIAEAKYEYEVEADDEELAIERALVLFENDGHYDPADVLEWRAEELNKLGKMSGLYHRLLWRLRWLYYGCLKERRFISYKHWQFENM